MTDFISSPYSLSSQELKVIKNSFDNHTDWDKSCFDGIKVSLKDDLRPKQGNLCCYCKWKLGFDIKQVDIEHIVPKSEYSKFTFHPKNLALSCPGCNTNKSNLPVLHRTITNYPRAGTNLTIVHPYFDKYSEHIEIHDGAIYEGLSAKGCETIKLCKLFRLKKVLEKKKETQSESSPIAKLVADLNNASDAEKMQIIQVLGIQTNQFQGV
jgi:hypothetical protein